jgi:hypothetical protein
MPLLIIGWPSSTPTVTPASDAVAIGPDELLGEAVTIDGVSYVVPIVHQGVAKVSPNDVSAPAANTTAVVTYAAAGVGLAHIISGIVWSYNPDPTTGNLKIEDGAGNVIFSTDPTSKGPGFFNFIPCKKGSDNTAMIITLAAGGTGVVGKLSITGHWTE